jgi:hypothetical protein
MLAQIQVYCPRNEGRGWKLQKLHEMLHLVIHLKEYCHASNFDAGRGEQLLKSFFKDLTKNCQQRGQTVFTEQLVECMFEKWLIQKALYSINGCNTQGEAPDLDLPGRHSIVGMSPSFIMEHFPTTKHCSFRWLGSNESVQVHPTVLSFFGKQWETLLGESSNTLDCYTEFPVTLTGTFHSSCCYWTSCLHFLLKTVT